MGWFDEQIRQRKESDQEVFEDSIFRMASVVLGKQGTGILNDERIITKAAIDDILKYYHYKPSEIPDSLTESEEQLEYCLRPHGLMRRNVKLEEGWYKDAYGPVLAFRKTDGIPVALLPKPFTGYWYKDPDSGEKKNLNKENAANFDADAICFYRPLPLKKLGIPDLIIFLKNCLNTGDYVLLVVLTLLVTLVGMVNPSITKALTGFVRESKSISLLIGTAVFLLSAIISSQLINTVRSLMMNRIEIKTSLSVEAAMMMRVMNLPANFFRDYSSGELSSRFGAVNSLCELLLGNVFSTGLTSLVSLLYVTQIFRFAPALVVPAIAVILASVFFSIISALTQVKISKSVMEKGAEEAGLSYALISGIQKIKLAGAEKRAFARWAGTYSEAAELSYNPPLFIKANSAIASAISLAGTILIYYIAIKTKVSPPDYMAFNSAFGSLTGAFAALTGVALSVAQIKPILEMAEPILKTEPESSENKKMVTSLKGNIELSNVYFRYNETMPYIVNGMSLKIKAGEYIAIVGTTGCGKSTLLRLLLGFETPERGAVYFDGKDISKLDLRSLRRRIGVVTQNGNLFQGDIYSNIVISAPQLGIDDAWEAAEIAGIADDIRAMPMGMQTIISEGQGGISGGQKQRLMIARAIAPKPKILMLDEATSALDNKTQKQVSDALDKLKCTRIVIAHRLSTIKNCDRILVLDKGNIMEDGTYDELIEKNGLFAELVARQRIDVPSS
ncbi:MAG: NHLP bacteriocin export ABC transporter permease/ATPase subunit [Oscillospiraceae bacterium]|jgi:NHLM bacteriocin system ABC transporter ATP-binding protein|nr:NHLP bacteriocin export ABC transporter permease/ATPase subunit [Oscillospiraceae bacterium]MBQ2145838.1 NHLP bacteriocin export ABC transporter permease/ATPase subunit [Oscillospiraceae bacterium]